MRLRYYILLNLLIVSSLQAQIAYVEGEQYGTWGTGDTLSYYVTGNVNVPASYFLTILPGVEVRFLGQFNITVLGGLTAWGTETDSVIFRTFEPEPWQYIEFIYPAIGAECVLNYCRIQSGEQAVRVTPDCQVSLNNCMIQGMSSSAVWGDNAVINLTECTITQNGGNGVYINNTSVTLTNCEISFNTGADGDGIDAQGNSTINMTGGSIHNNSGSGIYGLQIGTTTLSEVEIYQNGSHGIELQVCGGLNASHHVLLYHNDLHGLYLVNTSVNANNLTVSSNGGRGISFSGTVHILDVSSSIVDRNTEIGILYQSGGLCLVRYNDVYLNFGGNYSGVPDTISSIELDPQYVDWANMDYNLQETSPCIDAGDPDDPYDPDSTITDMGALYFNQSPGAVEPGMNQFTVSDFRIIDVYPNPFNPVLTVRVQAAAPATAVLEVWTAQGRLVERFWEGQLQPGINTTTWNADRFSSGVYVVRMASEQNSDTVPCVLLK